jgi:hypothetical protein
MEMVKESKGLSASASPTACSPTAEPPVSAGVSSASPLRPTGAGCITDEQIDLLTRLAEWYESGPHYPAEFEKGRLRIADALKAALAALTQPPCPLNTTDHDLREALRNALPVLEGIADELSNDIGATIQEGGRPSAEAVKTAGLAAARAQFARDSLSKAEGRS